MWALPQASPSFADAGFESLFVGEHETAVTQQQEELLIPQTMFTTFSINGCLVK